MVRLDDAFVAITSLPLKRAASLSLPFPLVPGCSVTVYSHTRLSSARLLAAVFEPRLAATVPEPLQPSLGATGVGRPSLPVALNAYGALRSRLGRTERLKLAALKRRTVTVRTS